jgi:NAD(P)-dependent dehydrogenase (short-subunit alcohol dehydrogenase family)
MTTILITGANRGIGLEFVRQYAKDGATLIACCRDPSKAAELNKIAGASSGKIRVIALDVASTSSIDALARDLKGTALDIVINNAGISGPRQQGADAIDPEGWLETFRVNAVAPVLVAQALRENLKKGHDKKLVAITSFMGSTANHGGGMYAYRSSKAALNNAMRGLSREWSSDGIAIAILHPGWVRTDMGGKGAPVAPEDSVAGLRKQIAALSSATSGRFVDYTGAELAW